ncbi:MAG: hypothetical protein R3E86_20305 [Pseudomonadales bacterium]
MTRRELLQALAGPLQLQQALLDLGLDGQQLRQAPAHGTGIFEIDLESQLLDHGVLDQLAQDLHQLFMGRTDADGGLFRQIFDLADEQPVLLLMYGAHAELAAPADHDPEAPVGQLVEVHHMCLGADIEQLRLIHAAVEERVATPANEHDTERHALAHTAADHVQIARLENLQRQQPPGNSTGCSGNNGIWATSLIRTTISRVEPAAWVRDGGDRSLRRADGD